MGTPAIAPIVEEAGGKALTEWVKGWFTHSGEAQLRSLGKHGEFTADLLKKYEQYRDSNKSYIRNQVDQVFKSVPEQHHQDLENAILQKPHALPQQYLPQAQKLDQLKNTIETKSRQTGTTVLIRGKRVPFMLHPEGPYVHHPDILKPNSVIRKQATQEVSLKLGVKPNEATKIIDNTVRIQNGRNGVSHISFPSIRIESGRLPVAQRWSEWSSKAAERVSQNVFFGAHDQQLQGIIEAVRQSEGTVSANTLADFFDVYMKETNVGAWRRDTGVPQRSAYTPTQQAERVLHKVTGYVMTSRIALPHSTQLINTILNEGLRNTLAGIGERLTNWSSVRDLVVNSGAMEEELSRVQRQVIQGKPGWFEKFFHQPGFNWIRARQVEISALAGKHEAIEASQRFLQGDKGAELTLKRLGIDTQELSRTKVLSETMKQQAAYNAGKQAIFFRTPLNTPFKREAGPLGRMSFTYSHFHFNMFRTIKNSLKNEYTEHGLSGVASWMAKIGILFPIAGELVQLAENGLYRRKELTQTDIHPTDNEYVDQYFNALAHASAFGIIYSINRANKQQMVTNTVVGPVAGTGINVVTDITKAINGSPTSTGGTKHDWRPVERDILRHIPVVGPTLSGTLVPYEDKPVSVPHRSTRHKKAVEEGNIF